MNKKINLKEVQEQVQDAILILAANCDGASKKDDAGFNSFDTAFGKSMAQWIQTKGDLTPNQFKAAWKMATFYKRQIPFEIPPFDAAQFEQSKKSSNGKTKYISLDGGQILIVFGGKPSTADRAKLDELSFRRWDPNIKDLPWIANASDALKVQQLFGGRPDWKYAPAFLDLVDKIERDPNHKVTVTNNASKPKITVEDGKIRYYFGMAIAKGTDYRTRIDKLERKWNSNITGKPWESPLTEIERVRELFADCHFTQDFNAELQKIEVAKNASRAASTDFDVPGMRTSLFPFQRAGVENIERSGGRHFITDKMGLGKTAQALGYLQLHPELRPAIIVVPAAAKINWSREIKKFMTNPEVVQILQGQKPDINLIKDATILIINYHILSYWYPVLAEIEPKALIVDEAHKIKNPKAQRTKAIVGDPKNSEMVGLAKIAKAYIPMTGTPIRNRPMELFTHLNAIDPASWGNWFQFATRYNSFARGYGLGAARNLDELHEKIKPWVTRRTKREVMSELPEKMRATIVLEFSESERAAYEEYINVAANTTGTEHLAAIEKAKQAAARGKLPATIEWIREFLQSGEKLVVFATHREITGALFAAFSDQAVMIRGGMSDKKRQNAIDEFQNNSRIRLFVGNMQAAGVAITLTAASNVAIMEFPWTPDDIEQAIDRVHRIGQTETVTAWHLAAENTIDEHIISLLEQKAKIAHQTLDGQNVTQQFSILGELSKIIKSKTEDIRETIKE